MDNVTHSLIGAAVGHALTRVTPIKKSAIPPTLVVLTSIVANNLPDLDLVVPPIMTVITALVHHASQVTDYFAGYKIQYLIHHRGFTHTLIAAPLMAFLALGIASLWHTLLVFAGARLQARRGKEALTRSLESRLSRQDWLWWLGIAVLGILTHISADAWNEFGVRPFWPIDRHWYYGEMVFILEPMLWLTLLPVVFVLTQNRWGRGIWAVLGLGVWALIVRSGLVPPPLVVGMSVLSVGVASAAWVLRKRPGALLGFAAGVVFVVLGFFATHSHRAGLLARAELERLEPGATLVSLSKGPAPGNPWCWKVTSAQEAQHFERPVAGQGGASGQSVDPNRVSTLVTRVSVLSLWPEVFAPATCFARFVGVDQKGDAVVRPLGGSREFALFYRDETPSDLLRAFANSCWVDALARFTKVLYWRPETGEAGDLRYYAFAKVGGSRFGFASLMLSDPVEYPPDRCPVGAPRWRTPMSDWLRRN